MQARHVARFEGTFVALALLIVLFAPMVVIHFYGLALLPDRPSTGEVTVGIAVILRATARRLLRGASSNLLRTTAGALGRTSARALTRRAVKFAGRLFFRSVVSQSVDSAPTKEPEIRSGLHQWASLGLGFAGLCLSFWGILKIASTQVVDDLLGGTGLGMVEVSVLAGVPLLAYAGMHQIFGRFVGVQARYRTEFDGLLLQAYFTGAGSFLPLTTDVEYIGDEHGKRRLAICSILGMFATYLVLYWAGDQLGSARLSFLGSVFLIYCFVYCFPIKPLEGHFIWSSSKLQWALVALPILAAFLRWLPPAFGEIL